jgi:hypothetical protein
VEALGYRDEALRPAVEEDVEVVGTVAGPVEVENVGYIAGSVVAAKGEAAFAEVVVAAGRWADWACRRSRSGEVEGLDEDAAWAQDWNSSV